MHELDPAAKGRGELDRPPYAFLTGAAVIGERLKQWLDGRRARYPAEHNVGHLYRAPPVQFYRDLDPTNSLNPGIGQTSMRRDWR
ncbi:MAG: hypothetical protein KGO22_08805 [Gammaproteobacteria bacterium]|nr:hypothetical protein [Gammaproteobacteria bacterium]